MIQWSAFAATAAFMGWMWGVEVARADDAATPEGPPVMSASEGPPASPAFGKAAEAPASDDTKAGTAVPEKSTAAAAVPEEAVAPSRRPTVPKAPSLPADQGVLEIETEPDGARVTIGYSSRSIDQGVGETPLALQLAVATYYISIEKEGFETATAEVEVVAGETRPLRVRLQPAEADRRRAVRIAGNVIFWPGLVEIGTGIGLIVAESKNREELNTGTAGIVLVGVGLAQALAGGLMLGLTYRPKGVYSMPQTVTVAPVGRGGGAQLSFTRFF